MMGILELEYKALNLMDQVCTVEVAFDPDNVTIHIFDLEQAVYPMYQFSNATFVVNDEFPKMEKLLLEKQFFTFKNNDKENEWERTLRWIFYSPEKAIQVLIGNSIYSEQLNFGGHNVVLYEKYCSRLKGS